MVLHTSDACCVCLCCVVQKYIRSLFEFVCSAGCLYCKEVKTKLDNLLSSHKVVLFMKGTPDQPECGFSAKVVSILKTAGAENDYTFVNVLTHPTIRDGIKKYSDWPTIPQLYVDGNFVGGCDIIVDLYDKGELHNLLDRALKHTKT
eukprot:GHVQ01023773.1.p1 GENE.GHVQ01023773.1~~GHVQ01023773.1.p1  ORF type:complete len:147 (+),score=11.31 GHVQ01023773.1:447-887(+)